MHAPAPDLTPAAHSRPMPTGFTTICVPTDLHDDLSALKVHPRQAYHEVIAALVRGSVSRRRGH